MTKAEKVVAFAESQVGMGYVWGANGQILTPSTLAQLKKQSPEHVDESIVSKWMGRNVYDCASFITHCMKQANIKMTTAGVSSQWKKTNWAEKGTIDTLPRDKVCCLYREDPKANPMQHGGVYLGNGYEIDARGSRDGVIKKKVDSYKWSHWGIPKGLEDQNNDEVIKVLYKATVYAESGSSVRMRAQPNTNAEVIKNVPLGIPVDVLEEQGEWFRIGLDGTTGYMMSKFLKKEESDGQQYFYVKIPCESREQAETFAAAFKKAVVD